MKIENFILIIIISLATIYLFFELIHLIIIKRGRIINETDEDYWIWGIFYYNPDDPRIIVPKRIDWLGWTLNFAKPGSIMISVGIILIIIINIIYVFTK